MLDTSSDPETKLIFSNGEIIAKAKPSEKIQSIEKWTDAFLVFISIYGAAHPAKVLDLIKYMSTIRLGASRNRGLGFRSYDDQFRLKKAFNPSSSWAEVDYELWLIYMTPQSTNQMSLQTTSYNNAGNSLRCYNFNYKGSCIHYPCKYRHTCMSCSGPHPVCQCPLQKTGGVSQVSPSRFQSPRGYFSKNASTGPGFPQRPFLSRSPFHWGGGPRYSGPRPHTYKN